MNDAKNNAVARTMAAGRISRASGALRDPAMVGLDERAIVTDRAGTRDTEDTPPGHDGDPRWRLGRLEAAVLGLGFGTPAETIRCLEEMVQGFSAARRAEAEKSRATTRITAKMPTASSLGR